MSEAKSKFPTMGNSAATTAKNASAEGVSGKLVTKKGAQAGDPAVQKSGKRAQVKASGKAAYGIRTSMPAYSDPAAGQTQGNGRLFSSAINRTAPNFQAGYTSLD